MKTVIARVGTNLALEITEVDISQDAELEARYGLAIPVLEMDGRMIAKYRIGERELARAVEARQVK